jgi:hypothetical protein
LQLVEERIELNLASSRETIITAGWSQMVRRRILDSEQIVEHGPHIALPVARLASAYIQDHNASGNLRFIGRLNGEGEPKVALEMDSADDRSERARESVCTEVRRARVPTELVINGSIASPFSRKVVHKLAHRPRRDDLELGHVWRVDQSSGPNASVGAAETSCPLASERKPGP